MRNIPWKEIPIKSYYMYDGNFTGKLKKDDKGRIIKSEMDSLFKVIGGEWIELEFLPPMPGLHSLMYSAMMPSIEFKLPPPFNSSRIVSEALESLESIPLRDQDTRTIGEPFTNEGLSQFFYYPLRDRWEREIERQYPGYLRTPRDASFFLEKITAYEIADIIYGVAASLSLSSNPLSLGLDSKAISIEICNKLYFHIMAIKYRILRPRPQEFFEIIKQSPLNKFSIKSVLFSRDINFFPISDSSSDYPSYPSLRVAYVAAIATVAKFFYSGSFERFYYPNDEKELKMTLSESRPFSSELNKFVEEISHFLVYSGVNFRSDCHEGSRLGEAFAISNLQEILNKTPYPIDVSFKSLSGETITLSNLSEI